MDERYSAYPAFSSGIAPGVTSLTMACALQTEPFYEE